MSRAFTKPVSSRNVQSRTCVLRIRLHAVLKRFKKLLSSAPKRPPPMLASWKRRRGVLSRVLRLLPEAEGPSDASTRTLNGSMRNPLLFGVPIASERTRPPSTEEEAAAKATRGDKGPCALRTNPRARSVPVLLSMRTVDRVSRTNAPLSIGARRDRCERRRSRRHRKGDRDRERAREKGSYQDRSIGAMYTYPERRVQSR